jgi:hypothetical protein
MVFLGVESSSNLCSFLATAGWAPCPLVIQEVLSLPLHRGKLGLIYRKSQAGGEDFMKEL